MIKNVFNVILDAFYPHKCVSCGEISEYGDDLCLNCRRNLKYIDILKRCRFCGREKQNCDCQRYVHRFTEIVSVFEYTGVARRAMLRYKISSKPHYSKFFAECMAKNILSAYGNKKFDCICFVPSDTESKLKRGFVPTKEIAKRLSKLFLLPLNDCLFVANPRKSQHLFKGDDRFTNAAGKYECNKNMIGKTVLLIDDVMTTGATLDDCTRALLFAGADNVYCATALITVNNTKKLEKK